MRLYLIPLLSLLYAGCAPEVAPDSLSTEGPSSTESKSSAISEAEVMSGPEFVSTEVDEVAVVLHAPEAALADPADLIVWKESRYPRFDATSVVNASNWLWDGLPAGAHGAVTKTASGDLVFEDGTPARFWGTTLTYAASFPDRESEIAAMADAIAAKGYNLVRFHHNDHIWGSVSYIKNGEVFELSPERMATLDKVMKALTDRGIYIYLDLVDSRGWTEEVGMPDWQALKDLNNFGWKGVFPMPEIVTAWKRATDELLGHVNSLTGLSLAEDPAVVCVEIINENGPFWDWGFKTTPSVQAWFDAAWNSWLVERYGDRSKLVEAWTDANGTCGLFDNEDPGLGNVYRPQLQVMNHWDRSNRSKARGAARYNDFVAFYREIATEFYQEASAYIRDTGYQGQIIGSHELRGPQNQLAEIEGAGSISAHLYARDQLAFSARPGIAGVTVDGVDVSTKNWFSNIARINVAGTPGWNNEWTVNSLSYKADSYLAIASMMALQGVDGSIHFGWSQRWAGERMPDKDISTDWVQWRKSFHNTFNSLHDSPSMAVHRICAALMRRNDLPPLRYTVQIAHSAEDAAEQNLHAVGSEGGTGTVGGAALFLPMLHRMETTFFEDVYTGDADVVFSTGRSASGDYRQAKHAVVLGDNPWMDRYHKKRDLAAPARLLNPQLKTVDLTSPTQFTVDFGYETPLELVFDKLEAAIEVDSIPQGAWPIGLSEDGHYTLGWCDDRFLVMPTAAQFDKLGQDIRWLFRFYLVAAQRWGIDLGENHVDRATYFSDNGVLRTDWGTGTQLIDSPRTQAVAGFAGFRDQNQTRNLSVTLDRPYGVVALTSVDGEAIADSQHLYLVASGRIQNTGTKMIRNNDGKVKWNKTGKSPMLIEGLHGRVELLGLSQQDWVIHALDSEGRRLGKVPFERNDNGLAFDLNPSRQTLWFEIATSAITGPVAEGGTWPAAHVPTPEPVMVERISVSEYLELFKRKASAGGSEVEEAGSDRIDLNDASSFKPYQAFGNMKATVGSHAGLAVLDLSFGLITQDWHAGMWFDTPQFPGLKTEDCQGLTFFFLGDGTMPRDCHVSVKWKDAAGQEHRAKSINLNQLFEDTEWREVVLTQADFPDVTVDFSRVHRIDFGVVSKLMETRHSAKMGGFRLATSASATQAMEINDLSERMPVPITLAQPELSLPIHADIKIIADGDPSDAGWAHAVGLSIDEGAVPAWQQIGSVIASGNRKEEESAQVWMLGTQAGLALYVAVDKGGDPVVNANKEWYDGDALELFVDAPLAKSKPSKQLFFAYKRPGLNRATASVGSAQIGRVLTAGGYALEILIPWKELGVEPFAGAAFGLDFQIDIGDASGRYLQLSYATGTNEAWFTSARYLKVTCVAGE